MNGSRLALARKLCGLTQTQLAQKSGVTPRAISKFEQEGKGLGEEKLEEIANILGVDLEFFAQKEVELPEVASVSFRARSKMSAKKRDQALAASALGIEFSDWMDREFKLPMTNVPDYEGYDPETAARALRAKWGLGEGPVGDMIAIMEGNGIRIFSICETSQEIDAYSFWDERRNLPFVFLSLSKSGERRRMDAAHELGHIVLHRKTAYEESGIRDIEREANDFASAFLMPDKGFRSQLPQSLSLNAVMRIKRFWKTSAFAVVFRAHRLGQVSDWQYHNLCVQMSKKGLRTREPDGIIPERSRVLDQVIRSATSDYGSKHEMAKAIGIPYRLLLSLSFEPPVKVVSRKRSK